MKLAQSKSALRRMRLRLATGTGHSPSDFNAHLDALKAKLDDIRADEDAHRKRKKRTDTSHDRMRSDYNGTNRDSDGAGTDEG